MGELCLRLEWTPQLKLYTLLNLTVPLFRIQHWQYALAEYVISMQLRHLPPNTS